MLPIWLSGKESACQCRRLDPIPGSGRSPGRRKWQPTPVFLPGKFHEQNSLEGYSPWARKEVDMTEAPTHVDVGGADLLGSGRPQRQSIVK